MTYEQRFLALLPKTWPIGPSTSRSEQAALKGAIDVTFKRRNLYIPKHRPFKASGSVNHKIAAADVYGLFYGDWKPLLGILDGFKEHGLFRLGPNADETCTTSYLPFYVAHLMMSVIRTRSTDWVAYCAAIECLSGILWWLQECSWKGSIYSPGLRVYQQDTPPHWHNDNLLRALEGKKVPLDHKQMDNKGGRQNKAGYPRSTAIWLTLIARERGLLGDLCPRKPKIAWGLISEKLPNGIFSYFAEKVTQPEHDVLLAIRSVNGKVTRWDYDTRTTPALFDRVKEKVIPLS